MAARVWDFSISFEPKIVANAMARFWKLDGWKFTPLVDANERPVDHCPISLEPMEDPVLVCDGHIYDKGSITRWLTEGNKLSPCTGEELSHTKLLRIQPFCSAIEKFLRHLGEMTEAEAAARAEKDRRLKDSQYVMSSSMKMATFLDRKLRRSRPQKLNCKSRENKNTISAGHMAMDALQEAINISQAEIDELQAEVKSAQKQLDSLREGMRDQAARVVQRLFRMKPLQEKATMIIQRWYRDRSKSRAWRERSEKLAKQCAMAIANGREELVDKFQSKGDLDYLLVLKFLKSSTDVNQSLPPGVTPLYKAAVVGATISARLLCLAGADKDAVVPANAKPQNAEGHDLARTALYAAARGGHLGVVKTLCELRADTDKGAMRTGASPLFTAAEYGHGEVVKILCRYGAATNKALVVDSANTGLIPLHAAAKNGHFEVVRHLCACRADVCKATLVQNVTELIASHPADTREQGELPEAGVTPLFLAVRGGYPQIVQFLCQARADVRQTLPESGCTMLHMACRKGFQGVVDILLAAKADVNIQLKSDNEFTPLHAAASFAGCPKVVMKLFEARADLNQVTGEKDLRATALYLAAAKGFADVVTQLCKIGADVNMGIKNSNATPLYMACLNGHIEVVRTLCLSKADLNSEVLRKRQTPLLVAAKNGNLEIVKTLCAAHAAIQKASATQATPLHMAALNGHMELAEGLVRNNADVNAASSIGATPLHLTALNNHPEMAKFLCHVGADKNACAKKPGSTALMLAVLCGHTKVVDVLCEDAQAVPQMLSTSHLLLHVASRQGHADIVIRLCKGKADVNEAVSQEVLDKVKHSPQARATRCGEDFEEDADTETLKEDRETPKAAESAPAEDGMPAEAILESAEYSLHLGSTPLFLAALHGHLEVAKELFNHGARVDFTNIQDEATPMTPLIAAIKEGHFSIARGLLKANAQVNGLPSPGLSPVYFACQRARTDMVQLLWSHKANMRSMSQEGEFPLLAACRVANLDIIQILLEARADINQTKSDRSQHTALTMISEYGSLPVAQALCEARADVNRSTADTGATALFLAAEHQKAELVTLLGSFGADPNHVVKSPSGWTALATSASKGNDKVVASLLAIRADVNQTCDEVMKTPLMIAAEKGHTEVVKRLAGQKAALNAKDTQGRTALHHSVIERHTDVVNALCSERADVNVRSDSGATALVCAAELGEFNAAKHLMDHRANLNLTGKDGYAPVRFGVSKGSTKLVEYLMRHRADVNVASTTGSTPLHKAVQLDESIAASMVMLLAEEADVNKQNQDGVTPLVAAVERLLQDVVKTLCLKRADVELGTHKGVTALLLAAETGQLATADMLLTNKANVNRANVQMKATPLHIASYTGNTTMVRKLLIGRAQVDRTTTGGHTPLHYATWAGRAEVTEVLLEAGADKHLPVLHRHGVNAFFMAVIQDHQKVLEVLFKGKGLRPANFYSLLLHLAARNGQGVPAVRSLCELRCDVNKTATEEDVAGLVESAKIAQCPYPGSTPVSLMTSMVKRLDDQQLQELLNAVRPKEAREDREENPEIGDFEEDVFHAGESKPTLGAIPVDVDLIQVGASPLFMAAYFGHSEVVPILLDARAFIDQTDSVGYTPLAAAADEGMLDVVKILCERRANVNCTDQCSKTPLQLAASNARGPTVYELCRSRADVNYVASKATGPHRSALHMATASQAENVVRVLVDARASLNAFNDDGLTALGIAAELGNPSVVQTLCEAGADGNIRSPSTRPGGNTALDLAHQNGHSEAAKILASHGVKAAQGDRR